MAKISDNTKAHLIVEKPPSFSRQVTVSVRPFRLAFIVDEKIDLENLSRIFEYNCLVWGGYYNLIIPCNGMSVRSDWLSSLINYDPDIIFITDELSEPLLNEIHDSVQPFKIWKWSPGILENHLKEEGRIDSLPLRHILTHYAKENPVLNDSNLRLLSENTSPPYELFLLAMLGKLPKIYNEFCIDALKAQYVRIKTNDLKGYLSLVSEIQERMTPIDLTGSNLNVKSSASSMPGLMVVVSGRQPQRDLCLFWNLRMQPRFLIREKTIVVPYNALKKGTAIQHLAKYCVDNAKGTNCIGLASASIGKASLMILKQKLIPLLKNYGIEHIDIWHNNFKLGGIIASEKEQHQDSIIEGKYFSTGVLTPSFKGEYRRCSWVQDLSFDADMTSLDACIPPKHPKINDLLSGSPKDVILKINRGYSIRLSGDNQSLRIRDESERVRGIMPSDLLIMESLFNAWGFSTAVSDKSKYIQNVIKILGSLEEGKPIRDRGFRTLMDSMKTGRASTIDQMMHFLRPGSETEKARDLVSSLALKGYFRRGFKLHCPACDMTRWYPLKDVSESMFCEGCMTSFQPPINAPFSFKLNELISRAVDQGGIPVILTLLFLKKLAQRSFMHVPGLKVINEKETDIDIVASCDGQLILCECKDLGHDLAEANNDAIYNQLYGVVKIALKVQATLVFFSCLAPSISSTLLQRIEGLNKRLKGAVKVHVLGERDLEIGHKGVPHPMDPTKEFPATLLNYMPEPLNAVQGWIREPGSRKTSL